jgi:hypothetical protein
LTPVAGSDYCASKERLAQWQWRSIGNSLSSMIVLPLRIVGYNQADAPLHDWSLILTLPALSKPLTNLSNANLWMRVVKSF